MILGIDPKVDYAFKHLLGRESTRPILIDVLDKVLDTAPGHHIQDIELLNPFNPKEALDDKLSILDIKARDQAGRQFNVEMQMLDRGYYDKRILYYWAKLHQQQLVVGQPPPRPLLLLLVRRKMNRAERIADLRDEEILKRNFESIQCIADFVGRKLQR